jgi:hypothetical protein
VLYLFAGIQALSSEVVGHTVILQLACKVAYEVIQTASGMCPIFESGSTILVVKDYWPSFEDSWEGSRTEE